MEIRKVTETDDIDALSRIYALSWKAAYRGIVPQDYLDGLPENYWSALLKDSRRESLVILDHGAYVGTSSICPAREETMSGWGEIISIYLLPEYFAKGYGGPLLAAATTELGRMGFTKIYLWVLEANLRARAFYEKHGFVSTSEKMLLNIGGKDFIEMRYAYSF